MAFLNATILNDIQSSKVFNDKRPRKFGLVDMAYDGRAGVDYIDPMYIQNLATMSSDQNLQLPVLKDQTVTVTTTPGFANIPINIGESANYYFTAYDVFSGFRYWPALHANNQVSKEFYVNNILFNVLEAMAYAKEGILKTVIDTRKSQVFAGAQQISMGDGTFTFSGSSAFTLTLNKAAQKDTMFSYLTQGMDINLLPGNYAIVNTVGGLAVANAEQRKYGMNNTKDIAWDGGSIPFANRYESSAITTSANFDGYLVRSGALSFFENHPFDFANGTKIAGKEWSVSDMELPFIKSRANIFVNNEATDATALVTSGTNSNLKMTTFEEMAIWDRFYVVYRYNSDLTSRANDVVKLIGATT